MRKNALMSVINYFKKKKKSPQQRENFEYKYRLIYDWDINLLQQKSKKREPSAKDLWFEYGWLVSRNLHLQVSGLARVAGSSFDSSLIMNT